MLAVWASGSSAAAQPTETPCFYQYVLGRASVPDQINRTVIAGGYLYAASDLGLVVYDLSDPAAPVLVGQLETDEPAEDVDIEGSVAYLACQNSLQIVSISSPTSPALLGSYETDWGAHGVDSDGSIAVLANEILGFFVFDVSDPTSPALLGGLDTDVRPLKVRLVGDVAYVADSRGGLQVADLSDPTSPSEISWTNAARTSEDVEVDGSMVYLAGRLNGWVDVIDCTDLANPVNVGGFDSPGSVGDLAVYNGLVYYTDNSGYLVALDVSTPSVPTVHSVYPLPYRIDGVTIRDGIAYVGNMHMVDISNPPYDPYLGEWTVSFPINDSVIEESSKRAVVSQGLYGVRLADLNDPFGIVELGSIDTPGAAGGAAFYGPYVLVADGYAGLQVIDATDPGAMSIVGNLPTPNDAWNVTAHGGLAYLSVILNGMQIVDLSDPTSPSVLGGYDDVYRVYDIAVRDGIAYLAAGEQGLHLVDVSDPTQPQMIGFWDQLTVDVTDLVLDGDLVLCSMRGSSVQVVDVSDPSQPVRVGLGYTITGGTLDLRGDTLYVATGSADCVHVVDFSDPTSPTQAAVYFDNESLNSTAVLDDVAYIRTRSGFKTVDFGASCGACPADLNNDGLADLGDIQLFIQLFLVQDPAADTNGDGVVDFGDTQAFIAAFLVGC